MMLTYDSGMSEDSIYFDTSSEWSLQRTTTLLSDESAESLYSNTELFCYSGHTYETPIKIKNEVSCNEWQSKFIDHWSREDCLMWLFHELQDLKVTQLTEVKTELIAHMSGAELKDMGIDSFNEKFPGYGSELYYRLQKFKARYSYISYEPWNSLPEEPISSQRSCFMCPQEPTTLTDLDSESHSAPFTEISPENQSDSSIEKPVEEPQPVVPEKRRPGRPRGTRKKKKPEKLGRLWEFIRDLLLNPQYNPSMICWENYDEGMFRFVHSDKVAKLWGSKKENEDMNYEKLSRAMRYYYKSQVLLPVYGKRLVYKFGPTATGWRSENPIMRCQG